MHSHWTCCCDIIEEVGDCPPIGSPTCIDCPPCYEVIAINLQVSVNGVLRYTINDSRQTQGRQAGICRWSGGVDPVLGTLFLGGGGFGAIECRSLPPPVRGYQLVVGVVVKLWPIPGGPGLRLYRQDGEACPRAAFTEYPVRDQWDYDGGFGNIWTISNPGQILLRECP